MNSINNNSQWKLLNNIKDLIIKSTSTNSKQSQVTVFELSKEWITFLQKYTPTSMLGIHFNKDTSINDNITSNNETSSTEIDKNSNHKTKNNPNHTNKEYKIDVNQPWKTSQPSVSQVTIMSSVCHILSSIATAESIPSIIKRTEELIELMNKYQNANLYAVKEGGIKILLRIKEKHKDELLHQVLREALAMLGYAEPLPGQGIRILSIDGGGMRGIAVIELLKKLEELSGKRIYEMFDFVCGVSTGSILLSKIGIPSDMSLDDLSILYKSIGTKIFSNSYFNYLKYAKMGYYDINVYEELIKQYAGETKMIQTNRFKRCPKLAIVSCVGSESVPMEYVFRNYAIPHQRKSKYLGSHKYQIWQAVRASSAAPLHFEPFSLDKHVHKDGGMVANNPTAIAIHEASLLWPNTPLQCVVSCGTGKTSPIMLDENDQQPEGSKAKGPGFLGLYNQAIHSVTDTESVHSVLSDILPKNVYFRFNPYLSELMGLDVIDPNKLALLELDTELYIRRNVNKFEKAVEQLSIEKSTFEKIKENIKLQAYLLNAHL